MTDVTEVAIKYALEDHLRDLVLSPTMPVSWSNVVFVTPTATRNTGWLRATLLPADTVTLSVDYESSNQHQGFFQVDVFYGQGGGELAPSRIAASILSWFKRGTRLTKDNTVVEIQRAPFPRRMMQDDPWIIIPVMIPYVCFALNT